MAGILQIKRKIIILSHRRESMQRAAGTSRMVPDPQTAKGGSDATAACGRLRGQSEWQWSARDEGVMPRTFAGYHNRKSGTKGVSAGKVTCTFPFRIPL